MLINNTDEYVHVPKGLIIGTAEAVDPLTVMTVDNLLKTMLN